MKKKHTILSILGYATVFAFYFFLAYFLWYLNIEWEIIDFSAFSLNKKAEIAQFRDPGSNRGEEVYFVISNPPENKDSLLSLVSKHFQSFTDTIEKYARYNHEYYRENTFTRRNYNAERNKCSFYYDYITNRRKDLLIRISVDTKLNEQEIVFYKKGNKEKKIYKIWKEE